MVENIVVSLIYILPVGGVSYTLLRYYFRVRKTSKKQIDWPEPWKVHLSLLGAVLSAILAIFWIIMIWFPGVQFPLFVKILFFILLVPFGCFIALICGLGKAVEAGAGSATLIIDGAFDVDKKDLKSKSNSITSASSRPR